MLSFYEETGEEFKKFVCEKQWKIQSSWAIAFRLQKGHYYPLPTVLILAIESPETLLNDAESVSVSSLAGGMASILL